jgi:hypothetical protein
MAQTTTIQQQDVWASSTQAQKTKPGTTKIGTGFVFAEKPKHETFNWILNLLTQVLLETQQNGIPQYNSETQYKAGGLCLFNKLIYQAQKDVTNQTPGGGGDWKKYSDTITSTMTGAAIETALKGLGRAIDIDVATFGGKTPDKYIAQDSRIINLKSTGQQYGTGVYFKHDNKENAGVIYSQQEKEVRIENLEKGQVVAGGIKITNTGRSCLYGPDVDPSAPNDIPTKKYVDDKVTGATNNFVTKAEGNKHMLKTQMRLSGDKLYITL